MTAFKGANKTKWDAGGSGDNIISDGYIKAVEKVWIDSFDFTAVLTTADTVDIAVIPANKKITDVIVSFPSTFAPTSASILVGITGDTDKFIDSGVTNTALGTTVRMNNTDGLSYVTTAETTIILSLDAAITAPTAGTIKTIVKYT